jgi:hypothetical protein
MVSKFDRVVEPALAFHTKVFGKFNSTSVANVSYLQGDFSLMCEQLLPGCRLTPLVQYQTGNIKALEKLPVISFIFTMPPSRVHHSALLNGVKLPDEELNEKDIATIGVQKHQKNRNNTFEYLLAVLREGPRGVYQQCHSLGKDVLSFDILQTELPKNVIDKINIGSGNGNGENKKKSKNGKQIKTPASVLVGIDGGVADGVDGDVEESLFESLFGKNKRQQYGGRNNSNYGGYQNNNQNNNNYNNYNNNNNFNQHNNRNNYYNPHQQPQQQSIPILPGTLPPYQAQQQWLNQQNNPQNNFNQNNNNWGNRNFNQNNNNYQNNNWGNRNNNNQYNNNNGNNSNQQWNHNNNNRQWNSNNQNNNFNQQNNQQHNQGFSHMNPSLYNNNNNNNNNNPNNNNNNSRR